MAVQHLDGLPCGTRQLFCNSPSEKTAVLKHVLIFFYLNSHIWGTNIYIVNTIYAITQRLMLTEQSSNSMQVVFNQTNYGSLQIRYALNEASSHIVRKKINHVQKTKMLTHDNSFIIASQPSELNCLEKCGIQLVVDTYNHNY